MKKVFLALIALMATMSISAQVIKVYENGNLTATYVNNSKQTVKVVLEDAASGPNTHDFVEIGGLKWATMNLGATTVAGDPSTCYGDYYAWGDTEPRYTSITISGANSATFGGWDSAYGNGYSGSYAYSGATLDVKHDAATQKWGSSWRTPTSEDIQALVMACTGSSSYQKISSLSTSNPAGGIYWLTSSQSYLPEYHGVAGTLFVDQTDTSKRLFFPAAGYCSKFGLYSGGSNGSYWSSSPQSTVYDNYLYCGSSSVNPKSYMNSYYGLTVRPVSEDATAPASDPDPDPDSDGPTSTDPNLLPGKFSVAEGKQVQFTVGNLYWDGEGFQFEGTQTAYPKEWNTYHVGHFYWSSMADIMTGNPPYAETYNPYEGLDGPIYMCWCFEENTLTVAGTEGLYILTGGEGGEWDYLINKRPNASSLYKYGVTVTDGDGLSYQNCLIIAPDNYTGMLPSSLSLDELNTTGLVCLPAAGGRDGSTLNDCDSEGYYCSSTTFETSPMMVYGMRFSDYVNPIWNEDFRPLGNSIRLVRTIK